MQLLALFYFPSVCLDLNVRFQKKLVQGFIMGNALLFRAWQLLFHVVFRFSHSGAWWLEFFFIFFLELQGGGLDLYFS